MGIIPRDLDKIAAILPNFLRHANLIKSLPTKDSHMFSDQEHHLVLEVLNKRRAWLLTQVKKPDIDYSQLEQFKSASKTLGTAIQKINKASPENPESVNNGKEFDFSQLKVLVVEDEKSTAEIQKDILSDLNFGKIDIAYDGNEALVKLAQSEDCFDLVLCDWKMPGKSGLEVHTALKSNDRFKDLIFILVSSVDDGDQIRTAITQGVSDYLIKPIDEAILKQKIIRSFKKAKNKN